jgi:hypothetical protein
MTRKLMRGRNISLVIMFSQKWRLRRRRYVRDGWRMRIGDS